MIVRPSSSQLLAVVRQELKSSVAAIIQDPALLAKLHMIDSILASVERRCDHEVAWIREEIADIEAGAEIVVKAGLDAKGRIALALEHLRANRSADDHLPNLHAEYTLAGEVLSCSLEVAVAAGHEIRSRIEQILSARLKREVEIRGEFSLAGRQ